MYNFIMNLKYYFSAGLFLAVFAFGLGGVVQAANVCEPEQNVFNASKEWFSLDIRRTISNTFNSALVDMIGKTLGVSLNQIAGCGSHLGAKGSLAGCGGTDTKACDALVNNLVKTGEGSGFNGKEYMNKLADTTVGGSLLGIAYQTTTYLENEPPPVNLAYFWADTVKNVPIVGGKVYAQSLETYSSPFLKGIIDVWKFTRNISLAIMTVVLLVTGVMIMLRRKISSQVVVTVQYALPKMVIGLILIIFSYPIGAFITQLAWVLFQSAPFLASAAAPSLKDRIGEAAITHGTTFGSLLASFIFNMLGAPIAFVGAGILLICVIVLALSLIVWGIKAFMIYIKMLFSIVTAPIEFMLGSIPGSEARISDWFKRMAKYTITLFFMNGIVLLMFWLALTFSIDATKDTYVGLGALMVILIPPIMAVYGMGLAIGMEKKVDEFIFGATTTKRK